MSERIYTKCPACQNTTLTINDDKHLLCTWIECPDPTLIDRLPARAQQSLTTDAGGLLRRLIQHHDCASLPDGSRCARLKCDVCDARQFLTAAKPSSADTAALEEVARKATNEILPWRMKTWRRIYSIILAALKQVAHTEPDSANARNTGHEELREHEESGDGR